MSLYQKTLGVVGMGNIGRVVAKKWIGAMEGKVVAYDPFAPEDAWSGITHDRVKELDTLLAESDVIYGAALDAMDVEPPTLDAYREMLENENVILTPHVGASTRENQSRSGIAVVETLLAVLDGKEVPNRVV
ncbi:hypothetical protein M8818_005873 [Zalaria obscura]|uniref:Uncharacterized protein n=1 Tax=Zalaria obscura TaxID=2024903 RepID=A0ACC3S7N2_9PEZI